MKKFILIAVVVVISTACVKDNDQIRVDYRISNAYSETEVSYRADNEQLIEELIEFESGEDVWIYSMNLERGDIVYLSARYMDSASSVKLQILMDGKIYKEGASNNEPEKYITVSGTIPYNQ